MRRIAFINQKGGVGKTTTTANLGSGLGRLGKRVLLVDIDPQANLSLHLDVEVFQASKSVYDVLLGRAAVEEVILPTAEPGVEIIPSHIDLCSAELELVNTVGREVVLRDALDRYLAETSRPPDYVLVDCPPSLGLLSLNALAAVEEVIIPIQAEFFALQGMGKLVEVVDLVRERLNPALRITGIVICMYRAQTTLAREVLEEVRSYFGDVVLETRIRQNIKLAEAPGHGKSIFAYDPSSHGAADYWALAREIQGDRSSRGEGEAPLQGTDAAMEAVSPLPGKPGAEADAPGGDPSPPPGDMAAEEEGDTGSPGEGGEERLPDPGAGTGESGTAGGSRAGSAGPPAPAPRSSPSAGELPAVEEGGSSVHPP